MALVALDFAALIDAAPDAAVVVRTDAGEIVFVNAQFEVLFGYHREQVIGQPIETLIPDRYKRVHVEHRRGYARAPSTRSMGTGLQLAARRQDGSEFPVEISLSSLNTDDGAVTIAFVRDITERRRADVATQSLAAEVAAFRDALTGLRPPRMSPALVAVIVALLVALLAAQVAATLAR